MEQITTIGLDIAKAVFQVHGVGQSGSVVVRRQLRRGEVVKFFGGLAPCVVGMEACGSGHYWARQVAARGHQIRLLPPAHVKPYVKRGKKNDAADAAAICEAASRPHLQAVPVRSAENQAVLQVGAPVLRLVGDRAGTELQRRQATVGPDHQNRQPLHPASLGHRRHRPHPLSQDQHPRRCAMGEQAAGAQAGPPRHRGAGQQDGTRRLGGAVPRPSLPRSGDAGRLNAGVAKEVFDCEGDM